MCAGSLYADLSATLSTVARVSSYSADQNLPDITMVFCIVEGGKGFVRRYRDDAAKVWKQEVWPGFMSASVHIIF